MVKTTDNWDLSTGDCLSVSLSLTKAMLRPFTKNLLLLEMLICFGPIFTMLMAGLLLVLPQQLRYLASSGGDQGSLSSVALVAGGLFGFAGLMMVMLKIVNPDKTVLHRGITLTLVGIGIVTLLSFSAYAIVFGVLSERSVKAFVFLVILPAVGSLHALYLVRVYL